MQKYIIKVTPNVTIALKEIYQSILNSISISPNSSKLCKRSWANYASVKLFSRKI